MEIIKRGHIVYKTVAKYRATCEWCGTVVEFEPHEIVKQYGHPDSVTCPLCGRLIKHDPSIGHTSFIPSEWKIEEELQ